MAKGSMAPARNVLFIHMVARSTIFPYQELAVFFSLSWNQYLFFYTLVYSTRSNIAIKRFGRRIQRLNFPFFLSISLLAVGCLLNFFSLFLPCPSIMKSLDSGILWKCKTNWTTGRQWTIVARLSWMSLNIETTFTGRGSYLKSSKRGTWSYKSRSVSSSSSFKRLRMTSSGKCLLN